MLRPRWGGIKGVVKGLPILELESQALRHYDLKAMVLELVARSFTIHKWVLRRSHCSAAMRGWQIGRCESRRLPISKAGFIKKGGFQGKELEKSQREWREKQFKVQRRRRLKPRIDLQPWIWLQFQFLSFLLTFLNVQNNC